MSKQASQVSPLIIVGIALWGLAGFAFASGFFEADDPMLGPLTAEEREMLAEMLAIENAATGAAPTLEFGWQTGEFEASSRMTSVTVMGEDITASSATAVAHVTVSEDDSGNLVYSTVADQDSVYYEGTDELLRQWIESPANDLSFTVSPDGQFVGPPALLPRAMWESSTGGALALANSGAASGCEPAESPIGVDGTTVVPSTICRTLTGPMDCPDQNGQCVLFAVVATPDAARLLELIHEAIPSAEDFSQSEIARVWLRQETGEAVAGETLLAQEYRAQFGGVWQDVQFLRRTNYSLSYE